MIFTVPLWGSEVANSKTEIHLTNTAVEVGMQRHIYAMSLLATEYISHLAHTPQRPPGFRVHLAGETQNWRPRLPRL